ncbi:MAG: hypothetical protein ACPGWR_06885 [Ardenticatenaceae bacterium]
MILFHGTNGEETVEKILSEGLVPFDLPHWAKDLAPRGQKDGVFFSTSPVAGKGGDPVSFAMGWPIKRWRGKGAGYVVVVDLPKEEQHRIKAAITNLQVDQYIDSRSIRSFLLNSRRSCKMSNWHIFYWLTRYLRDRAIPFHKVFDHLTVHVSRHDSLPPTLTVGAWEGFTREYLRFMDVGRFDMANEAEVERRRQAILRRHGIQLPAYIDEDSHSRQCALCLAGVFTYDYTIDGFDDYAPYRAFRERKEGEDFQFRLENMSFPQDRVIRDQLPTILRVVEAHFAACDEEKRQRFFARYESYAINWDWTTWYEDFPPDWSTLPAVWHPAFGQFGLDLDHRDYEKELRHADMQVLTTSIPAEYIIAVIKISDNQRLLRHIRPNKKRGETLLGKLWQLTHQARKQFDGEPIIYD